MLLNRFVISDCPNAACLETTSAPKSENDLSNRVTSAVKVTKLRISDDTT